MGPAPTLDAPQELEARARRAAAAYDLAPGNVLQNLYLRRRLRAFARRGARFYEVGAGNGNLSGLLLGAGLCGTGFDLSELACAINRERNRAFVEAGRYRVAHEDFLEAELEPGVDLVLSSMVLEHLPEERVHAYLERCRALLAPGGRVVTFVPAGMRHWGVEDDVAGHLRRYEPGDFARLAAAHGLELAHQAGLTYPVSNLLLGLSNRLVARREGWKRALTQDERTRTSATGARDVPYKTSFPPVFRALVNGVTLYPLHLLQLAFRSSPRSMVLYAELVKPA